MAPENSESLDLNILQQPVLGWPGIPADVTKKRKTFIAGIQNTMQQPVLGVPKDSCRWRQNRKTCVAGIQTMLQQLMFGAPGGSCRWHQNKKKWVAGRQHILQQPSRLGGYPGILAHGTRNNESLNVNIFCSNRCWGGRGFLPMAPKTKKRCSLGFKIYDSIVLGYLGFPAGGTRANKK